MSKRRNPSMQNPPWKCTANHGEIHLNWDSLRKTNSWERTSTWWQGSTSTSAESSFRSMLSSSKKFKNFNSETKTKRNKWLTRCLNSSSSFWIAWSFISKSYRRNWTRKRRALRIKRRILCILLCLQKTTPVECETIVSWPLMMRLVSVLLKLYKSS